MGNCSSSPVDGCSSSQTILKLSEFTADVELKLGELIVKKGQIVIDIKACNENNNNLFKEIIDKFTYFKNQSAECCEALQDALDDIIDELDDITGNTPVTTEEPTPTTTEEPTPTTTEEETPTTTEEPTTTTTEGPQYKSGLFNYQDNHELLCLGLATITLYYEGVIEVGTTLYVNQGITPFIAADYIKRAEGVVKYHLDGFGTIDEQLVDTCE